MSELPQERMTVKELLIEYRGEVDSHFTQVAGELKAVNAHLSGLNGSVARHELRLADLEIEKVRHDERAQLLTEFEERDRLRQERNSNQLVDLTKWLIGLGVASIAAIFYGSQLLERYVF